MSTEITVTDDLTAIEEQIEGLLAAIQEPVEALGRLLGEIRDRRLYAKDGAHKTFEDYCRKRWGKGRSTVNRWILKSITPKAIASGLGTNGAEIEPAMRQNSNADSTPETAPSKPSPEPGRDPEKDVFLEDETPAQIPTVLHTMEVFTDALHALRGFGWLAIIEADEDMAMVMIEETEEWIQEAPLEESTDDEYTPEQPVPEQPAEKPRVPAGHEEIDFG